MRMGIISQRRRQQRAARMRRRLMIAACVLLMGALAASPDLRAQIDRLTKSVQAFSQGAQQAELILPAREVYALQLAVFDNGERAADEAKRLQGEGVYCIVWQREKMRIVCGVASSREGLDIATAKGKDAYVIRETMDAVPLRLTCGANELEAVQALLTAPDSLLERLMEKEEPLAQILSDADALARRATGSHPEQMLYDQLAQSLGNWCRMIERTAQETDERSARSYAALTMCTLCRELRAALRNQA